MHEDNLKKADWLVNLREEIHELVLSAKSTDEIADAMTSIVIRERADMMTECERDFGALSMPDFKEAGGD